MNDRLKAFELKGHGMIYREFKVRFYRILCKEFKLKDKGMKEKQLN